VGKQKVKKVKCKKYQTMSKVKTSFNKRSINLNHLK
jgi:hypothetical protein